MNSLLRIGPHALLLTALSAAPPANAEQIPVGAHCSLAEAITAANINAPVNGCPAGGLGGDTILIDDDIELTAVDNPTNGANGLPSVTSVITVKGNGHTLSRDPGADPFRFFHVTFNGNLTLDDLTLTGGHSNTNGGAVYNDGGFVTVTNSLLHDHRADQDGGAVHNSNGIVYFSTSEFRSNHAGFAGGVVSNSGILNINGSKLSENDAVFSAGAIDTTGTCNITASILSKNTAEFGGGGVVNSGLLNATTSSFVANRTNFNQGGAFYNNNGHLSLNDLEVTGNSAISGGGIATKGGSLTLVGGTIDANSADQGAGIHAEGGGILSLNSVSIRDNIAANDGGGVWSDSINLNLTAGTISGNTANRGAGIHHVGGGLFLDRSLLDHNIARLEGGGLLALGGDVRVENTSLGANAAQLGAGGGIHAGTPTIIKNSTLAHNTSALPGGALHVATGVDVQVGHSILAYATAGGACGGDPIVDQGYNLVDDSTCDLGPTSLADTDPELGPLADNGGPTLSYTLPPTSPAVDAGNTATCLPLDQRNTFRPQQENCDIGAIEFFFALPTDRPPTNLPVAPAISGPGLIATLLALLGIGLARRRRSDSKPAT